MNWLKRVLCYLYHDYVMEMDEIVYEDDRYEVRRIEYRCTRCGREQAYYDTGEE